MGLFKRGFRSGVQAEPGDVMVVSEAGQWQPGRPDFIAASLSELPGFRVHKSDGFDLFTQATQYRGVEPVLMNVTDFDSDGFVSSTPGHYVIPPGLGGRYDVDFGITARAENEVPQTTIISWFAGYLTTVVRDTTKYVMDQRTGIVHPKTSELRVRETFRARQEINLEDGDNLVLGVFLADAFSVDGEHIPNSEYFSAAGWHVFVDHPADSSQDSGHTYLQMRRIGDAL